MTGLKYLGSFDVCSAHHSTIAPIELLPFGLIFRTFALAKLLSLSHILYS
jgi:hypothetical protein